MDTRASATGGPPEGDENQNRTLHSLASASSESMSATGAHPSLLGAGSNVADNDSGTVGSSNSTKALSATAQGYSPWDMSPIVPVASSTEPRPVPGLKGFSSLNTTSWPHFRSKPHPTISVPLTTAAHSRPGFDPTAPSTPRSAAFSNPEDSDNAMCTPTFGSSGSSLSRRNSSVSVMALDTPPPFSLMDLESSSSHPGSSFGSGSGSASGTQGSTLRSIDSGFGGSHHGYSFPLFGMRYDAQGSLSRRSSRANSISMESRHARKPSEDACMSDGGNNSGSERSRRHSPAVVPFERSVRRSALLPKPKGLLKVFNQLEEEIHPNRHEYDHEREVTQVWKGPGDGPNMSTMETDGAASTRQDIPSSFNGARRMSRLNPEQELNHFQQQQEEYNKLLELQQSQHITQLHQQPQEQDQQQEHQAPPLSPLPLQMPSPMQDTHDLDGSTNTSFASHGSSMTFVHPSLQTPIVTRAKRKSSTCEDRFDPYHSNQLKRRAVSPSIGPMISHRRSPSNSPARLIAGPSRAKVAALPSPSGTGSFFKHNHGFAAGGSALGSTSGTHSGNSAMEGAGASGDEMSISSRSSSSAASNGSANGAGVSSTLNLQNTSRSFSELSLDMPKDHPHYKLQ